MEDDTKTPIQRVADAYKTLYEQLEGKNFTATPNSYMDMVTELQDYTNCSTLKLSFFIPC